MQIKPSIARFYYIIACVWSRYVPILMLLSGRQLWLIIKLKLCIIILILKATDSTDQSKMFLLSPVYKQCIFAYTSNKKGICLKTAMHKELFSKQTCLKSEWRNSYEWMEKWYKYNTKYYNNKNPTKSWYKGWDNFPSSAKQNMWQYHNFIGNFVSSFFIRCSVTDLIFSMFEISFFAPLAYLILSSKKVCVFLQKNTNMCFPWMASLDSSIFILGKSYLGIQIR